jgi:hypothetical protein
VKRFRRTGYNGVLKHVDPCSCGSPTWGSFFVTICYQTSLGIDDDLALKLIGSPELLPRSFENCLKPIEVPHKLWDPPSWKCREAKTPVKPNHLGEVWQNPVVDPRGPALLDPNVRILLPGGLRQLDPQEWVQIKGLPKTWTPGQKALRRIVESPGAHEWGALGDFVNTLDASRSPVAPPPLPS